MESIVQPFAAQLTFSLGSFEGFNFRSQSAIERLLTANEVIGWNHDRDGEAEFWPSGDHVGVSKVFGDQSSVTASELRQLDALLSQIGNDSTETFIRIYFACSYCDKSLEELSASEIEDPCIEVFTGTNFTDLRKDAAYSLFENYYPEDYKVWEKSSCDGLVFDVDRFLDSPTFLVLELEFGDAKVLIVAP